MSPNLAWRPIRFTPQLERTYVQYMTPRIILLQRLACIIGIASFVGYQFWDLLLDPEALPRTAPIPANDHRDVRHCACHYLRAVAANAAVPNDSVHRGLHIAGHRLEL